MLFIFIPIEALNPEMINPENRIALRVKKGCGNPASYNRV